MTTKLSSGDRTRLFAGLVGIALGLALVFGTDSWRWLGALGLLVGAVLVLRGPTGELLAAKPGAGGCGAGHSCCAPREPASRRSGGRRPQDRCRGEARRLA